MTGAQDPDGGLDLPELTKYLKSQGVKKVIITTDDTSALRNGMMVMGFTFSSLDNNTLITSIVDSKTFTLNN